MRYSHRRKRQVVHEVPWKCQLLGHKWHRFHYPLCAEDILDSEGMISEDYYRCTRCGVGCDFMTARKTESTGAQ